MSRSKHTEAQMIAAVQHISRHADFLRLSSLCLSDSAIWHQPMAALVAGQKR